MINIPIICIAMLLIGFIIHSVQINSINNVIKKESEFNSKLLNLIIDSQVDIVSLQEDVVELMKEVSRIGQAKIKKFKGANLHVKRRI